MIVHAQTQQQRSIGVMWLAPRVGETPESLVWNLPYEIQIVLNGAGDRIVGAVLWNQWRGRSIETHWAGECGWLTRGVLREVFAFPFERLGCRRITGIIRRKNRTARKTAERIGFKLEGVAREGFEDGTDAMIYGMTRSDCRWLS